MAVTSLSLRGHSRRRRIDLMRMSTALLVVLLALAAGVPQCSCLFGSPSGNAETEDLAPQNELAGKLPSQTLHALLHLDTRSINKWL